MTVAAVRDKLLRLAERVQDVLCAVHSKNRAQLFVSEFLTEINGFHLADQNLSAGRNLYARQLGDFRSLLSYDFRVESAVDNDGFANLIQFVVLQEITAARRKLLFYGIVNAVEYDSRLLGGADHTVVKGFGVNDGVDRQGDVGTVVDDGRCVARAYAESGLAAGVRRLYHAGAACREDDIRLLHNQIGHFQRGNVDPCNNVFRCAGCYRRLQNDLCCFDGALLCAGMRADDDSVSGFQTNQRFKNCGGRGVCSGNNRTYNADRLGDLLGAEGSVFFDHAACFDVAVLVVDIFAGIVVLDDLVLHDTHAGFFHCHLRERNSCLVCCGCRR